MTGDYVVGGVGLRGLGDASGYATGTITIPDGQPNATAVPDGADIVAAFLYWQTVESSQNSFAGQQGFFNGFPITGSVLGNPNAPVSWSSGGCSGSANGTKTLRTYRTDVRPNLNIGANGRVLGNGQYQVRLRDSGSNGAGVPLTLGATLVLIYRVLSPTVPLSSVVLYDGAFAPVNSSQTMSQDMVGFYQAAAAPVAKVTHIVGNGQANKSESVYLNSVALPSLYGTQPPFPGYYNAAWDNPTWLPNNYGAAVNANSSSANTSVVPSSSNSGCVVWGAVVFRTTVQDSDADGLLDTWETNQGFTDVNTGTWIPLPGANPTVKDLFAEVDYLSNLDGGAGPYVHSHLPKQAALDKVGDAFKNARVDCSNGVCKGVRVHFDVGNVYQSPLPGGPSATCGQNAVACDPYIISYPAGSGGNAVPESPFVCTDSADLCQFPGQVTLGWKVGFLYVKNNATVPNTNIPLGNFALGKKDAYHYVLFGHALGLPRSFWSTFASTLPTDSVAKLSSVVVAGSTATLTIQSPAGLLKPGDPVSAGDPAANDTNLDRVTVSGAIGQKTLNGSYTFTNLISSTSNGVTTTTFTVTINNVPAGSYTYANEPRLAVSYGGPTSSSGHSDVGGGDSGITFGRWPADDPVGCQADPSALQPDQTYCDNQVGSVQSQAGTLMHEVGHSIDLTHGGTYYANAQNNPSSSPSYGRNCKPNYVSVMNYLFQIRGFPDGGIDYSAQTMPDLYENMLNEAAGIGTDLFTAQYALHATRWYAPPNALDIQLGHRLATMHCDGSPLATGEQAVRVDGTTYSSPIDWNNDLITPDPVTGPGIDVNFSGDVSSLPFLGFNDWNSVDLRQMGARPNAGGFSGGGTPGDLIGGGTPGDLIGGGTPGDLIGGGTPGDLIGGGATGDLIGGGTPGDLIGGGTPGDLIGGGTDLDYDVANSTVDAPRNLTATLNKPTRAVILNWNSPGFGQVRTYEVYRLLGSFDPTANPLTKAQLVARVQGAPPTTTYADTTMKNNTTYTYFVVAALGDARRSGPSNLVTVLVKF